MYICICRAVTDKDIREAVSEGALSFSELSFKTGCSTQCGSCINRVREILDETLQERGLSSFMPELRVVAAGRL